ncbi:MAG: V-type ATP synthase subunit D [Chloroflexota bacterium]|nr:V-type ATP synthase subunit D [Chloroflexota bacterium]
MPLEQVTATRSELNQKRAQLELTAQAEELLRQKRNVLMEELMSSADAVMEEVETLDEVAAAARRSLALAQALDGPEVLGSLALAGLDPLNVPVTSTRVMGVNVLRIEPQRLASPPQDRPYGPTDSTPRLEAVVSAFESELEVLLKVANSELRLRRLAEAIRQTTRRVNALEHILLPRLHHQLRTIGLRLAEREREEVYRLKRVKERRTRNRLSSGQTWSNSNDVV